MRRKILILGSTGSIGKATLDVIQTQRNAFEVVGLACKENVELLNEQIRVFAPSYVCVDDPSRKDLVEFDKERVLTGIEGMKFLINMDVDVVVNALSGSIGLEPTLEAIKAKKVLALANKESVVMAGRIISNLLATLGANLIPVDSEHSALFQLLRGLEWKEIESLIITCSGGPFRNYDMNALYEARPEDALFHPVWKMGKKITVDSATLMNKAFEIIEVRWLFDIQPERIKILIHPESIIHGLVEFVDGSLFSYMAYPDMKIPISFALNEERRKPVAVKKLNLGEIGKLTFFPPDTERFPAINMAYEALEIGDSAAVVMNAANEVASQAFMDGKIRFTDIFGIIRKTIAQHPKIPVIEDIEVVLDIHYWAKNFAAKLLEGQYGC